LFLRKRFVLKDANSNLKTVLDESKEFWKTEPTSVAIDRDDWRKGVKG